MTNNPEIEALLEGIKRLDPEGVRAIHSIVSQINSNKNFTHTSNSVNIFASKNNETDTNSNNEVLEGLAQDDLNRERTLRRVTDKEQDNAHPDADGSSLSRRKYRSRKRGEFPRSDLRADADENRVTERFQTRIDANIAKAALDFQEATGMNRKQLVEEALKEYLSAHSSLEM